MSDKKRGLPLRVKMRHDTHFVDELAARHGVPVGRMVPISTLDPDADQPRSSMGDLGDLVTSIREKGVLEPILVRPVAGEGEAPRLRIISGERRYRAALKAGLYEVPVIEMDVEADEALEIALIENLQRKDLTPFEEAEGYRQLGGRFGYTHEQIADTVGRSRSLVTETLALLQLPARVRDVAQALDISSKSVLLEVLKGADETEMIAMLEEVAARGLNRDDLRRRTRRTSPSASAGRRPYTFKFRSPDRSFSLALRFRRQSVERDDLIAALEQILEELRRAEDGA